MANVEFHCVEIRASGAAGGGSEFLGRHRHVVPNHGLLQSAFAHQADIVEAADDVVWTGNAVSGRGNRADR